MSRAEAGWSCLARLRRRRAVQPGAVGGTVVGRPPPSRMARLCWPRAGWEALAGLVWGRRGAGRRGWHPTSVYCPGPVQVLNDRALRYTWRQWKWQTDWESQSDYDEQETEDRFAAGLGCRRSRGPAGRPPALTLVGCLRGCQPWAAAGARATPSPVA